MVYNSRCHMDRCLVVSSLVHIQASHRCQAMDSNSSSHSLPHNSHNSLAAMDSHLSSHLNSHQCKVMGSSKAHLVVMDKARCRSSLPVVMVNNQLLAMDRRVHHRQDMANLRDSRVMIVPVGMECRVMLVVQGMDSVEVIVEALQTMMVVTVEDMEVVLEVEAPAVHLEVLVVMTTVVTEEVTGSAEGEVAIVMVVAKVVAHLAAVTVTVEDTVVEGMVVVEGHTVAVTEMAVAHLVVMMGQEEEATAVVEMTEDHMAEEEAVALVTGVVVEMVAEIRMEWVATLEVGAAVPMDRLVEATMRCSLNRTQYSCKVFLIESRNKSSLSILVPLV